MSTRFEVKCIVPGVLSFRVHNGGWGVSALYTFPHLPKSQPSSDRHVWYVLGLPSVVWWRGSEHGSSGYGLAILQADGSWRRWYNSQGEVTISIEQLLKAGVRGVFEAKVGRGGLNVTALQPLDNKPAALVVVDKQELSEADIEAIRALVCE